MPSPFRLPTCFTTMDILCFLSMLEHSEHGVGGIWVDFSFFEFVDVLDFFLRSSRDFTLAVAGSGAG